MSDTLQTNNEKIFESQIAESDIVIDVSTRYGQVKTLILHKTTKLGDIERLIIEFCNLNNLVSSNSNSVSLHISTTGSSNSINVKYDNIMDGKIQLDKDKERRLKYCHLIRKAMIKNLFFFKAVLSQTTSYTPSITHIRSSQPPQPYKPKPPLSLYYHIFGSCGYFKDALDKIFKKHNMSEYSDSLIIKEDKPALLFTVHYTTTIRFSSIKLNDEEKKDQFHGNSVWIIFHPPSLKKERDIPSVVSGIFLNDESKSFKHTFVHTLEEKLIDIMREKKEAPKDFQELLDEDIKSIIKKLRD